MLNTILSPIHAVARGAVAQLPASDRADEQQVIDTVLRASAVIEDHTDALERVIECLTPLTDALRRLDASVDTLSDRIDHLEAARDQTETTEPAAATASPNVAAHTQPERFFAFRRRPDGSDATPSTPAS